MLLKREYFEPKVGSRGDLPGGESFAEFLKLTRKDKEYGDDIHLVAFALLFNCCIVVHKSPVSGPVFASVMYLPLCLKSESEHYLGTA